MKEVKTDSNEVEIKKIIIDQLIYPRSNKDNTLIKSYYDASKIGSQFPPIVVQEVEDYHNKEIKKEQIYRYEERIDENNNKYKVPIFLLLLDGAHRLGIHELALNDGELEKEEKEKYKNIKITKWKDEILDFEKNIYLLKSTSIQMNTDHGVAISNKDRKEFARELAESFPVGSENYKMYNEEKMSHILKVSQQTISNWIRDIRDKQKNNRNALIYRLNFLGYTQQEIADMVGLTQQAVGEITKNTNFGKICNSYEEGKSPEDIAEFENLDLPLVWKILLKEKKDDINIFEKFGDKNYSNHQPKLGTIWNFAKGDLRLGYEYEGRMWCQDVMNILYRYSNQNDLVIDPMAGGGTVIDTCLIMNRKCRAFDINPIRDDIIENDIEKGYPKNIAEYDNDGNLSKVKKKADLIIFDPPYYKKKEYDNPGIMKDRDTFINFIKGVAQRSYEILNKNKYLTFLFSQYIDYDNEELNITYTDIIKLFEEVGFRYIIQIQSPLTFNNQYQAHDVERAKEETPWKFLPHDRNWEIFKRIT